ncbi:MAG: divergent polysaccharide deacetylase family protein [Geminicoccaceae bacterium]
MGVWWQNGRRGRHSPSRLLGHFLETRYGAAEGVLGAVAVVLVVWMLWPEASGPQLDQRAIWQQSVEESERRRQALDAGRPEESTPLSRSAKSEASAEGDRPRDIAKSPVEPSRQRIARPSELADRLDEFGQRPGQLAAARSFLPGPKRPPRSDEPAVDIEIALQAEASTGKTSADVRAALTEVINNSTVGDVSKAVDSAALSNEVLETEPLPEIDLSDLDSLAREETVETVAVAPDDPVVPSVAVLAPSLDAAVESPIIVPNRAAPLTDLKERPLDDAPTWLENAVAAAVDDERPIIAIVIDDLGLNRPSTAKLNDLPSPLTLAFLPYAGRIEAQTEAAQAAGHELMLHLPMEPIGSAWPGPDALTTKLDQKEFVARLEKNLNRFQGFVGINNHMGSKLTADGSRMDVVMRELRKRDVLFLDSKTSARSIAGKFAGQNGVPNTTRDVFLDHVIDLGAIKRQLALTETIARRSGSAVAIGHPHKPTIQALREWLPSLEARGFVLAPISAVVARRACSDGVLIAPQTCGRYLQAGASADSTLAANGS